MSETPRDLAFCAHAVLGDELFEVPDALDDPRFADNPLVASQPDIRFYAGAPVKLSDGSRIGTLCVIDRQPKRLTESQRQVLRELALAAAQALEGRRALRAVKQVSRQMAESEARFRALSESMPIGVFEIDTQGQFTYANERLLSIFGLRRGQGLAWTDVVHPDDRAVIAAQWAQALAEPRDMEGQFRVQLPDGTQRHVRAFAKRQLDAGGQVLAFVGTVEDVSEALAQQEALRTSQAFLDRTGRLAGVGGWEVDLLNERIYWSDETCRIHRLPPGYTPSMDEAFAFYAPESKPLIQQAFESAIHKRQGFDLELRQILRDGRSIWVRSVGNSEFEQGRVVRVVGAFQDVTERVNERKALEEAHSLVKLATDSGGIGIWDYDLVQGSLKWDAWMYRLYGLSPTEALGPYDLWARHLHPEDRADAEAAIQMALEGRRPFANEFRIIWSDGSVHHIRGSALIKRDEAGRPLRMVGVNWDTSEHHQAQALLLEAKQAAEGANQAKSQFLANMSHEIRTPMNAILGMLTLLRKTALSERQADYTVKTEGAARALLGLLNEILDFSKVEAGKMSLDPQPMKLDQLLRDLAVILASNVGSKKLELLFDIDPSLPNDWVADAMRLQQVLVNLSGNAIKFTEKGEVVLTIQALAQDAEFVRVRFAVRDTGIGIAPENQARIFAGFTQAEASITRRFGGTGLGVAISQRLVALMGGELSLHSELGRGSCFEFSLTLPKVKTPPGLEAEPQQRQRLRAEPGSRRALVVDDNALCREVLERLCVAQGWTVDLAASGEEAIALLQARAAAAAPPYQALFVDWQMPGMDGWQTIAAIRALNLAGASPLIVMVTAQDREQLAQREPSEQAVLAGYLVKPITASMLFDAVANAGLHSKGFRAEGSSGSGATQEQRLLGLRLLLVEDNINNQQVASELLRDEGASVQLAGDGQQALDVLARDPEAFDVVLMDLQMPVMDGLTATRQVRERLGLRDLPIVAMTANAMSSDRQVCLDAGMNDHVAKPFDLDELVRVLRVQSGRSLSALAATRPLEQSADLPPDWLAAAAAAEVDLPAALGRMGGKPAVYQRMLRNFAVDLPAMQTQLRSLLDQGDAAAARLLLHTLKGLAATLGAQRLADEAGLGERAAASASADSAATEGPLWRAGVEAILHTMSQAGPGLQRLAQQMHAAMQPPVQTASAADVLAAAPLNARPEAQLAMERLTASERQDLQAQLQDLLDLLRDSDMEALQFLPVLQARYGLVLGGWLEALDEALSRLEFDAAMALCRQLLGQLGSQSPV
ncbi:PAS domain-containing protein [Roseateles sp.]|uniref:PAS domain-containing protein n=1 Tax=Roseateles sp. TaxID=1971397 RepID=UPI003BA6D4FC